MRHDKIPTVIFTKKEEPQEQQYHCKYCFGSRMVRMDTGLRCQICGSPEVAIRTIILKDPSSFESSRHSNERSE